MAKIIALVGASGSGKSTLTNYLFKNYEKKLIRLLPITDRNPRENEVNNIDKIFVDTNTFDFYLENGKIKNYKSLYGNRYAYFDKDLKNSQNSICDIHYLSYLKFKKQYRNVVGIYIRPIDTKRLIVGINSRGASKEECMLRESMMRDEIEKMEMLYNQNKFDSLFVNQYDEDSKVRFLRLISNILS